jgi:hypothetical protein
MGGIAGGSLPVTWLRARKSMNLGMASFQVGWILSGPVGPRPLAGNFQMILEVTPLLQIRQPARTYGFAASPLHLRWNFRPMGPIRAFAESSAGVLMTGDDLPARTTSLNFIDQAGFGLRFEQDPNLMWLFGYRFQHISNGGRVRPNPGRNFNLLYAGLSFLR